MTIPFRFATRHKREIKSIDLENLMCYNLFRVYPPDIQSKASTYLIVNMQVSGLLEKLGGNMGSKNWSIL